MTNLDKMNELVGSNAPKEEIKTWAYMNRVPVSCLHFEEKFEAMEQSIDHFIASDNYGSDEHENWDQFLDAEYIEEINHE